MTARRFSLILALILILAPATARAGSQTGSWRRLPAAPVTPEFNARTSVWTGKELLVFGRDQLTALDARGNPYATGRVNVAAAYNPRTKTWRRLAPPAKTSGFMDVNSVWTGKEMLVWGQGTHLAYDPATNRWQQLPSSRLLAVHDGFGTVVWTGHEMIGWGGGCCGDAFSDGVAYSPATNEWRALPRGPLPGSQHPLAAWTGKELIVLVGAHGAAYSPARNTWRTIATPPAHDRATAALWDGHELVVAGGSRAVLAYAPATNRWRHLPALPAGRAGKVVVWTGIELLVWGGNRGGAALVPGAARWTPLAHGPLPGRVEATAVWSGSSMIVWGGIPTKTWGKYAAVGATFTPPTLACGDGWMGENLVATPKIRAGLRTAYVAAHPELSPHRVGVANPGHTYYGRYSGTRYAVATFGSPPTIFRTDARGLWRVRQQTSGAICSDVVPIDLIRAWSLPHRSGRCFGLPG